MRPERMDIIRDDATDRYRTENGAAEWHHRSDVFSVLPNGLLSPETRSGSSVQKAR